MSQVSLSIIEVFISLVVESTILAGVFSYLTNKANEKQEQQLKEEMTKIETQAKQHRDDILNQIKESTKLIR